ncbi:MAG: class I SAM-dependent methyltransferase [Spirochaetales bacterium]|nr:class I SAM-dependent methyltransferase [Spirochaetales bacterium]
MNNTKRFYDQNSQKYADEWYSNNSLLLTIRDFLSLFPSHPRILDLGCGPGQESMRLSNENAEVVGIDFSTESIKIAKCKNPNLTFYCMDYFEINTNLGFFDGIFACSSLIHNTEVEIDQILKLITKVLKPNGYFCMIYIKGEGQRISYPEIDGEKMERIVQLYTAEKMKNIFCRNSFEFSKLGYLDDNLKEYWENLIFKKL